MNRRAVTLALCLAWAAFAEGAELGMEAPPLKVAAWIKGGPVTLSSGRGTNVYVLEFWSTWCGACRPSLQRLTELQQRFQPRGLTVVGLTREPAKTVKPFVDELGDALAFAVGLDDDGQTTKAYLDAFGEDGVPHAFIIDRQGRIVWHGHPMDGLDRALVEVLENRFDLAGAKQAAAHETAISAYFARVIAQDPTAARELGLRIAGDPTVPAKRLNEFAWIILTHPRLPSRDLDLALRAARSAAEQTRERDPDVLDTYARALFASGQARDAIDQERKAVAAATDPVSRSKLERALQEYEATLR